MKPPENSFDELKPAQKFLGTTFTSEQVADILKNHYDIPKDEREKRIELLRVDPMSVKKHIAKFYWNMLFPNDAE